MSEALIASPRGTLRRSPQTYLSSYSRPRNGIDLKSLRPIIGGFIEILPPKALTPDTLRRVTILINENGKLRDLQPIIKFEFDQVLGPVLGVLTDEDGQHHGAPREQAEAVARALNFYGVGFRAKAT